MSVHPCFFALIDKWDKILDCCFSFLLGFMLHKKWIRPSITKKKTGKKQSSKWQERSFVFLFCKNFKKIQRNRLGQEGQVLVAAYDKATTKPVQQVKTPISRKRLRNHIYSSHSTPNTIWFSLIARSERRGKALGVIVEYVGCGSWLLPRQWACYSV